jgi:hypothetical protein
MELGSIGIWGNWGEELAVKKNLFELTRSPNVETLDRSLWRGFSFCPIIDTLIVLTKILT